MAQIEKIDIKKSGSHVKYLDAEVTVRFSKKEQELGLRYSLWVTLYDEDAGRDYHWLYPNFPYVPSDRYATSAANKDDFIAHLPNKRITADRDQVTVTTSTPLGERDRGIRPIRRILSAFADDSDKTLELRARAVVIPETSFAVKWSDVEPLEFGEQPTISS